ncbi:hypothetical protein AB5I41_25235 [Sphingomonas sp. MMS24-JH45]
MAPNTIQRRHAPAISIPDPLDADMPGDEVVVTTRRALVRVALVASETGARFQREAIDYDSMAWMLSPRAVFDGLAPVARVPRPRRLHARHPRPRSQSRPGRRTLRRGRAARDGRRLFQQARGPLPLRRSSEPSRQG